MTPRALLLHSARLLSGAGVPDPEQDASLMLARLTGAKPLSLRTDMDTQLPAEILEAFEQMMRRRLKREPLQYILGSFPFQGMDFLLDARVLIPRPETSLLVDWALELLAAFSGPSVLDLCCGSGCIGLSVKKKRPDASVTLTDLSPEAVSVAKINAERLDLEAGILEGDLFSPVPDRKYDLVLSNPPYIPSSECASLQREVQFEPLFALDGGEDGMDFYRRIAAEAPAHLRPGGRLLLELGIHEAGLVRDMLLRSGAKSVEVRKDFADVDRMMLAVFP